MQDVLTPEDYELLLSLGQQNSEDEAAIQMMLQQAQRLRDAGQMPGMRGNGRIQTAAHPLEFLASMANQNVARQKDKGIMEKRAAMGQRTNQQNNMVTRGILSRGAPGAAPAGPGFMPQGMGRPQFSLTPGQQMPNDPYALR